MVSPGTHPVKNQESQSTANDSQFKERGSPKLNMLGSLCNQSVSLKTEVKTLCYITEIKI